VHGNIVVIGRMSAAMRGAAVVIGRISAVQHAVTAVFGQVSDAQGRASVVIGWFADGGVQVAADWMAVTGVEKRAGGLVWGEGGVVRYGGGGLGPQVRVPISSRVPMVDIRLVATPTYCSQL